MDQVRAVAGGLLEAATSPWGEGIRRRALHLLLLLPREVCPKWRLAVARAAWGARSAGVVASLALLPALGPGGVALAQEIVTSLLEKEEAAFMVELADAAPLYLCSLAKCVVVQLGLVGGRAELVPACSSCSSPSTTPGTLVSAGEVAPLLRLLGHPDALVRRRLVGLLRPSARHTALSEAAATLWVNCAGDADHRVRYMFAGEAAALLECRTDTLASRGQLATTLVSRLAEMATTLPAAHLDTFLATLVTVAGGALPAPARRQLLTTLLGLYCAPASNVATYARALPTLKAALASDKRWVVAPPPRPPPGLWCSGAPRRCAARRRTPSASSPGSGCSGHRRGAV